MVGAFSASEQPETHLASGTLLGVPLPILNLIGPVTQKLVPLLVLPAVNAFMPGRMALKTPYKLARWTLNLKTEKKNTTITYE